MKNIACMWPIVNTLKSLLELFIQYWTIKSCFAFDIKRGNQYNVPFKCNYLECACQRCCHATADCGGL